MNRILHHTILPGLSFRQSVYAEKFSGEAIWAGCRWTDHWEWLQCSKKENIVEINNIHENSNGTTKYTKDSSDEGEVRGKGGDDSSCDDCG